LALRRLFGEFLGGPEKMKTDTEAKGLEDELRGMLKVGFHTNCDYFLYLTGGRAHQKLAWLT
jgi:hypothetical protein